jgi:hypothetical protein
MSDMMTPTHWRILAQLNAGTLEWGAAVGACWPVLVANGYVVPHFGWITQKGKDALKERGNADDLIAHRLRRTPRE